MQRQKKHPHSYLMPLFFNVKQNYHTNLLGDTDRNTRQIEELHRLANSFFKKAKPFLIKK